MTEEQSEKPGREERKGKSFYRGEGVLKKGIRFRKDRRGA